MQMARPDLLLDTSKDKVLAASKLQSAMPLVLPVLNQLKQCNTVSIALKRH